MSGGSLDYVYNHVEEASIAIMGLSRRLKHVAFAEHLLLCARALKDLEWEFSGDTGKGDADAAIDLVTSPQEEISAATELLMSTIDQAQAALERLKILKDVCPKCDGAGHVMGDYRRLILCPKCGWSGKS